jgi:hypothetical protein
MSPATRLTPTLERMSAKAWWRTSLAAVMVTILFLGSPTPVRAWSNGLPHRPNSFGTHDWVLWRAIRATRGRVSWIRPRIALRASDDPDSRRHLRFASAHRWHNWGPYQGDFAKAPVAVRFWFRRTARQLDRGRPRAASRSLGIMAHLLADVAQPMHTDESRLENEVHLRYESKVDARCQGSPSACVYGFRYDGPDPARPSKRARALIRRSHPQYRELVSAVKRDSNGYNRSIHSLTKHRLNDAANAIADLILQMR